MMYMMHMIPTEPLQHSSYVKGAAIPWCLWLYSASLGLSLECNPSCHILLTPLLACTQPLQADVAVKEQRLLDLSHEFGEVQGTNAHVKGHTPLSRYQKQLPRRYVPIAC